MGGRGVREPRHEEAHTLGVTSIRSLRPVPRHLRGLIVNLLGTAGTFEPAGAVESLDDNATITALPTTTEITPMMSVNLRLLLSPSLARLDVEPARHRGDRRSGRWRRTARRHRDHDHRKHEDN